MAALFFFVLLGFLLLQGCVAVIVDVSPRESVVLARQNVTFLCRVGVPLQYCRVQIEGLQTYNLNNKIPPRGPVYYYGAGLSAGQCGFTIDRVDESNNGKITCFLGLESESQEAVGTMHLVVARPPKAPELDIRGGSDALRIFKVNDMLQAQCIVREGRPVANISWYLGDEPLTEGLSMATDISQAKEDLHSRIQNLTRQLQPSDNGKQLKCVATHPALFENNVAKRQIDVKYPPLPLPVNPIDKFGYELSKPGIIDVEIEANPRPHLEWTVREQRIKEGSIDSTGRIEAEEAFDLGMGHYKANLRIAAINKQDTQTQFVLTAYNDMGSQDYMILISTSPEPEGVEIGVGTIVTIIASVLVVLVAIFLLVFARIKGRWCFSGPVENRTVGESSDTESADTRLKERRRIIPPLKLAKPQINLNIFKRKEQTPPREQEETATSEPEGGGKPEAKDGIVYAELDLVSQNLRPLVKNDDDKTEYAEIVYTPADKEQQKSEK